MDNLLTNSAHTSHPPNGGPNPGGGGIGTYGERTLHRELKWRIEPSGAYHEIPVGKYIADIKDGRGITEIQTQSFHRLTGKLSAFLPEHRVTLVYPLAREKQIVWADRQSGKAVRTRRSPKRGTYYQAFRELYQIKALLTDSNLTVLLVLVDVSETRVAGANRKGYSRVDTQIRSIFGELRIGGAGDYQKLIPASLPERFTSADYAAETGLSKGNAGIALNTLAHVGAVRRTGKSGRFILYEKQVL